MTLRCIRLPILARTSLLVLLGCCALAPSAAAHGVPAPPPATVEPIRVDGATVWRYYSGPVVTWQAGNLALRTRMLALGAFLGRSQVPIKLRPAPAGTTPDITVATSTRYSCRPRAQRVAFGIGGLATVRVGADCRGLVLTAVLAHELGHALGLLHSDGACAVMNQGGILNAGHTNIRPYRCARFHNPSRTPFLARDLARLRAYWRNRPPVADFTLPKTTWEVYEALGALENERDGFIDISSDPDVNLARETIDWGDGTEPVEHIPMRFVRVPNWAHHKYTKPGSYTITLTAYDTYGSSHSKQLTIEVVDPRNGEPIWVD